MAFGWYVLIVAWLACWAPMAFRVVFDESRVSDFSLPYRTALKTLSILMLLVAWPVLFAVGFVRGWRSVFSKPDDQ